MKKTLSLIFTVLFLAVCLVPGLGLLLTGGADAAANEILPAAPVIAADGDFNPDFLAETAAYVNGRFSFRLEGITAWANSTLRSSVRPRQRTSCSDGTAGFSTRRRSMIIPATRP